jgi:hypothetical protein
MTDAGSRIPTSGIVLLAAICLGVFIWMLTAMSCRSPT